MIYWAPFLHFYQPPIQFHKILRKICDESYRPLLKVLDSYPKSKVTINVSGVLTEMLNEHNARDVIDSIRSLSQKGQIEFVESAKFHPILPLIPAKEMVRQIKLNHETNQGFFGPSYKPRGFFPPEMCYSQRVGSCLKNLGYEWVILSGIAHPQSWPLDFISSVSWPQGALSVFYRDDLISNKISFREFDSAGFIKALAGLSKEKKDIYVVTAMDAETFGHHIKDWEKIFLAKVYETIGAQKGESVDADKPSIEVVTISELLDKFPHKPSKFPRPSSWSTNKEDMHNKNYYPLWSDKTNKMHRLQWMHIELCCELVNLSQNLKAATDESRKFSDVARILLDKALHSCQFWWANKTRGFWSANLIHKGLQIQEETILNAYKAINIAIEGTQQKDCYYKTLASREIANDIRDLLIEAD